jgi:hypothetical protein
MRSRLHSAHNPTHATVAPTEHTWGVAQSWFLPDYTNWSNVDFDKARAQQPDGFIYNNTVSGLSVCLFVCVVCYIVGLVGVFVFD